jgi:hypothetical protein
MVTLHEDKYSFLIIFHSVFLRMRNASDKSCRENRTHILYSITFFKKICHLWDNVEKYCRAGQATDGNMARAHCMLDIWVYKYTLSYVTCIDFLLKQWLHECASKLCCTYIACLVCFGWKGCTYDTKNAEMSKKYTHYQWSWSFLTVSIITVIICYANKTVSVLSFVTLWSVSRVSETQMRKELTLPSICMWYNWQDAEPVVEVWCSELK